MSVTLGTDAYCEVADVQAIHLQRTIGTTTKPSTTQVEGWIKEAFNLTNGTLKAVGYSTPVATTATKASSVLKTINVNYVAARVEMAAYAAGVGGVPAISEFLQKQFDDAIKLMSSGKLSLEDATTTTDLIELENQHEPAAEFNPDDNGDERDPIFTRDATY